MRINGPGFRHIWLGGAFLLLVTGTLRAEIDFDKSSAQGEWLQIGESQPVYLGLESPYEYGMSVALMRYFSGTPSWKIKALVNYTPPGHNLRLFLSLLIPVLSGRAVPPAFSLDRFPLSRESIPS